MKKIFSLLSVLVFALISCDRTDSHITIPENPDGINAGVVVSFNTEGVTNKKFTDTHIYAFDASQKMTLHNYYPTQQELASDLFVLPSAAYTFVAVLNVGETFEPEASRADVPLSDMTLSQLLNYLKQSESDYPDMLTGMITRTIFENSVERIEIVLADKIGGLTATPVTVNVTLPDADFTEYQRARSRATAPHNLRGIAEFYQKGKPALVQRVAMILTPKEAAGNYTFATLLPADDYDMTLWVDYTESESTADLWYTTESLEAIKIIATDKTYTSGSNTREVFYGNSTFATSEATIDITLQRPQAKYQLIADDITRYKELMAANPDKYVPLDKLSVAISYESYLPDGFNAKTGRPNSSQTGYKCNKVALPIIADTDTEVKVGSDYVFVNGDESSVTVTVTVTDNTGRTVSRVKGVVVKYKRNMLTTIRGEFLTAGAVNPGININTDWDGVFNVEF